MTLVLIFEGCNRSVQILIIGQKFSKWADLQNIYNNQKQETVDKALVNYML